MIHGQKHKKLGRNNKQRKALFLNLKKAVIEHGRIETTITKAKLLRPMVERLVTKAKNDDLSTHRYLLADLHQDEGIVSHLKARAQACGDRPGGYTRIVRSKVRIDKTQMAYIEFVDAQF